MKLSKNVQIPAKLFNEVTSFIIYLQFSNHQFPSTFDIHSMYSGLMDKQHNINLRKSYANIIHTKDDEQRSDARRAYLKLKGKGDNT